MKNKSSQHLNTKRWAENRTLIKNTPNFKELLRGSNNKSYSNISFQNPEIEDLRVKKIIDDLIQKFS